MKTQVKRIRDLFAAKWVDDHVPEIEDKPFVYEPLDENSSSIRLLTLLPGVRSDGVQCLLEQYDFGSGPPYAALSYTWGPPNAGVVIEVNGRLFRIRQNLSDFLVQFRSSTTEQTLWVDAICIYSHQTATKHLGSLRFAPQFLEGFNFTHLVSQTWQYKFLYLKSVHLADSST